MKVKVTNIEWDLDDEDERDLSLEELGLSTEMIVEVENEDEAIDACTDKTGWCIKGANLEIMK